MIFRNSSGKIESINIKTALNDTDYKKTTKLTWLPKIVPAENKSSDVPALVPCFCVFFNHLISKPVLAKDEDFKQYVSDLEDLSSCKTRLEVPMLGDPELRNVKKAKLYSCNVGLVTSYATLPISRLGIYTFMILFFFIFNIIIGYDLIYY